MDPSAMFPAGMNPLVNVTTFLGSSRSPREPKNRKDRIDVAVKYLFFDFGGSVSFPSFEERRIGARPRGGHDCPDMYEYKEDLPGTEFQTIWYDPFPADIYGMGTELKELFDKVALANDLFVVLLICHT